MEHSDGCKLCSRKKIDITPFSLISESKLLTTQFLQTVASNNGYSLLKADLNKLTFTKIAQIKNQAICPKLIEIAPNFSWNLYVYGKKISNEHFLQQNFSSLDKDNVINFFEQLTSCMVCNGNDDFTDIIDSKIRDGVSTLFEDDTGKGVIQGEHFESLKHMKTIRSTSCAMLIQTGKPRCDNCTTFRKNCLYKMRVRNDASPEQPSKFKPNVYMSKRELQEKSASLQQERKLLIQKVKRLQQKIEKEILCDATECHQEDHNFLKTIITTEQSPFGNDTPMGMLWEEQKRMALLESKKSMQWHPLTIRWCLSIYLQN